MDVIRACATPAIFAREDDARSRAIAARKQDLIILIPALFQTTISSHYVTLRNTGTEICAEQERVSSRAGVQEIEQWQSGRVRYAGVE